VVAVSADTQITDLTFADYACLTFGEAEELLDLTAAFVRDGPAGGQKVVWLSDSVTPNALALLRSVRRLALTAKACGRSGSPRHKRRAAVIATGRPRVGPASSGLRA
jgi:hypothetical protein